jgi:uncharacterized MAPEG superfamily protein
MILVIYAVLLLFIIQTLLSTTIKYSKLNVSLWEKLKLGLGSRDTPVEETVHSKRADRAANNIRESLPVFLPIALLIVILNPTSHIAIYGGWVYFLARLLYVPCYLSGVFGMRTLFWFLGWAGLAIICTEIPV